MKQLKQSLTSLAAAAALAGLTTPSRAVDYYATNSQSLQNDLTWAAQDGANDHIYLSLAPGSNSTNNFFTGNFNFNTAQNYSLTIQGAPGTTNTQIILVGTGTDLELVNSGTGNFIVRGITVTGGALSIGGNGTVLVDTCRFLGGGNLGVSCQNVTVTNSVVNGASPTGMQLSGSSVTIGGCTVSSNNGCSIYIANCTVASLIGNNIVSNTGYQGHSDCSGNGLGGSMLCIACAGTINFYNNYVAGNSSPGVTQFPISASDFIIGNVFQNNGNGIAAGGTVLFSNNIVAYNGGGLSGWLTGIIANNTFTGNSGSGLSWGGYNTDGYTVPGTCYVVGNTFNGNQGGGVVTGAANSTITNNVFTDNSGGDGGALNLGSSATVSGNSFTGNSASSYGGAIYANGASCTISGNKITSNSASSGGGIYIASATSVALSDNLVSLNTTGGGIYVHPTASLTMINNTVTENTTTGNGGGLSVSVGGTVEILNVYNNIIWGNSASGNGADVYLAGTGSKKTFLYNDVDSMYGVWDIAANLMDVAPNFFDPVNGDFHLQSTSACLNAGTNGAPSLPLTDLDGNPRTNNLGQVDLGCYEFNSTRFHPADVNQDGVITATEYMNYANAWLNNQSWPTGPNPILDDYVTRAGYLQNQGGTYHNTGAGAPLNWQPGTH